LFCFLLPATKCAVYSKDELNNWLLFGKSSCISIISDETYEYINFVGHHESIAQFEKQRQVIIVNGLSKDLQ
jgi:aspartate aminotransferase